MSEFERDAVITSLVTVWNNSSQKWDLTYFFTFFLL